MVYFISQVLLARDYALLQGLPGTGKTNTLALITRCLLARGERVLLCSYTHAAVDHLLLKIIHAGCSARFVARIGAEASVDSALSSCLLDHPNPSPVHGLKGSEGPPEAFEIRTAHHLSTSSIVNVTTVTSVVTAVGIRGSTRAREGTVTGEGLKIVGGVGEVGVRTEDGVVGVDGTLQQSGVTSLQSRVKESRLIACTALAASRHALMDFFELDW